MELLVGASRVKIDFPENFFPHIGFRGRYFTGLHDDLHVRTIYIDDGNSPAVFVSIELGDVGTDWLGDIQKTAEVKPENVFLFATHTHSAPHVNSTWKEDVVDVEQSTRFGELCWKAMEESILTAKANKRPAKVKYKEGFCEINVNRDLKYEGDNGKITANYIQCQNPGGISDRTVGLLKFEDLEGKAIAYLINYAVHSCVLFYQTWTYDGTDPGMLISGDIAGFVMRYVEEHSDEDTVALFSMAAAGDQLPKYTANHRVFDKGQNAEWAYYGYDAGLVLLDAQARELGIAVMRTAENMACGEEPPVIKTAVGTVAAMGKVEGVGSPQKAPLELKNYQNQYKETCDPEFSYTPTAQISFPVMGIRIGKTAVVGIPAEIVTSIGAGIKQTLREHGFEHALVITQCNGSYSYISDDFGYGNLTFEGVSSHFMPGVDGQIIRAVNTMLDKLL